MPLPFAHLPCPRTEDLLADTSRIATAIAAGADRPDEPWAPGKWTRCQLAWHIADVESVMLDRVRRVLAEDEPRLLDIPQDAWIARLPPRRDPARAAALFTACRTALAELVADLGPDELARGGTHDAFGRMRLEDVLRHCRGHADHHARQLVGDGAAATEPATTPDRRVVGHHRAQVLWTGDDPAAGKRYSRVHAWTFDGGITVRASASPHVVPLPLSAEDAVDPEEAVVAAAASCHLLTFIWLAHRAGFAVARYADDAVGELARDPDGGLSLHSIALRPAIEWYGTAPDAATIARLHHDAHRECFIARSLRCAVEVEVEPPHR